MLLSICVPTYNRGKSALELATQLASLQEKYLGTIEVVVSNNGSTKGTEEYAKIKEKLGQHCLF